MVKSIKNTKKSSKQNFSPLPTFGNTCILSYEVFPPSKENIHERKFKVKSISGNIYTISVNSLVNCTCPDCQYRVRRCKHINFIMDKILHEKYPKIYYDNKSLDNLFKYLPGNIPHICK